MLFTAIKVVIPAKCIIEYCEYSYKIYMIKEMQQWLNEHVGQRSLTKQAFIRGEGDYRYRFRKIAQNPEVVFEFKNPQHAMLFKLTWK